MREYEEKAVSLALNRPKLQALTNKLKAARLHCPLFDTERWVRFDVVNLKFFLITIYIAFKREKCSTFTILAGKEFGKSLSQNVESALLGQVPPAF